MRDPVKEAALKDYAEKRRALEQAEREAIKCDYKANKISLKEAVKRLVQKGGYMYDEAWSIVENW